MASTTNFALNILLARWLLARDYGAYSVCWSVLLVLAAFHNALILEPMTVVGPSQFQTRLAAYFQANNRLNWAVSLVLSVIGVLFAFLYRDPTIRSPLLMLALCVPGYLILLTLRRKQYVVNLPLRALLLSLVYALLVLALISLCRLTGHLNALTGVAAFGTAWFAVLFPSSTSVAELIPFRTLARTHWRYGKWLFASSLLAIGSSDLQTLLLSMLVDLKAAGGLRALMNFVLPLAQLLTVLSVYALPHFSSRAETEGHGRLLAQGIFFPIALTSLAALYLGAMLLFAPQLERLLYAGKMQTYIKWMPLLAASAGVAAVGSSFSTLLRAIQNSRHIFLSGIVGTAVGVVSALLLQRNMGIAGALWSLLASNTATTLVIVSIYIWFRRNSSV